MSKRLVKLGIDEETKMKVDDDPGMKALQASQKAADERGISGMSLEQINEEIGKSRKRADRKEDARDIAEADKVMESIEKGESRTCSWEEVQKENGLL